MSLVGAALSAYSAYLHAVIYFGEPILYREHLGTNVAAIVGALDIVTLSPPGRSTKRFSR